MKNYVKPITYIVKCDRLELLSDSIILPKETGNKCSINDFTNKESVETKETDEDGYHIWE
jgi:hypothetical protein